ncbi:helix-turn-helix domain-containing protein [Brevibacillus laterosporus]|uniref:helix-turn-helix domain-containing protein n=1 Tax=Brevibacillus laterosporus TaxID=1465 RepID=UPI001EF365A6|nr:helix-turn-helix transcriptional regulator [Brevibacillus laterosporus]MCG7317981.1 helix-turn-helix domain-containing protein [Brevibacillus laterosporus]
MSDILTSATLGELIKEKREEFGITLSELSRRTGVSKGIISKIESGETKRPELRNLKLIADTIDIPYEDIIDRYIDVELRIDILEAFLAEAVEIANISLLTKVAIKFLGNPKKDTFTMLEHLCNLTATFEDSEAKLTLYNVIVKYARQHGVPKYIAKGLYQKYLIEIQNIKKVEDTFRDGEEVLYYTTFLTQEERINFYYQMAFHAHGIEKYQKCIDLGKMGHAEDTTSNEIKERVALAICNSYFYMNKFAELEEHLQKYEGLGYDFISERSKYLRAIVLAKTGKHQEAVPLLKECVEEAPDNHRLHRVNQLLEALHTIKDMDSLKQVLEHEEKNTFVKIITPYKYLELAKYFRHKGKYLLNCGKSDDGINAYLQGIQFLCNINATNIILDFSKEIFNHYCEQGKDLDLSLLKKLMAVYNMVNKGDEEDN